MRFDKLSLCLKDTYSLKIIKNFISLFFSISDTPELLKNSVRIGEKTLKIPFNKKIYFKKYFLNF